MRARQLSVLYRSCHGASTWRQVESAGQVSELAAQRGRRQLQVLIPVSYTNISTHDCTVRFLGVQIASLSATGLQRSGKGRTLLACSLKDAPKRSRMSPSATPPAPAPGHRGCDPTAQSCAAPSSAWTAMPGLIPASRSTTTPADAACQASGHTACSWTAAPGQGPFACGLGGAGSFSNSVGSSALSLLHTPTPLGGGPATCLSLGASGSLTSSLGVASIEESGPSGNTYLAPVGSGAHDFPGQAQAPGVIFALPPASCWADTDRAQYYARQLAIKAEQAYSCQQVLGPGQDSMDPGSGTWSMLWSLAGRLTQRRISVHV